MTIPREIKMTREQAEKDYIERKVVETREMLKRRVAEFTDERLENEIGDWTETKKITK